MVASGIKRDSQTCYRTECFFPSTKPFAFCQYGCANLIHIKCSPPCFETSGAKNRDRRNCEERVNGVHLELTTISRLWMLILDVKVRLS